VRRRLQAGMDMGQQAIVQFVSVPVDDAQDDDD
jgi:hypothetical protein